MRLRPRLGVTDEVSYSPMQQGDLPIYSIGAVERMLDIPAATIRNWEERYQLVTPERSTGGHRLYTRAQVEQLRFVKEGLDRGLQPAEAHRLLGEQLERGSGLRSADETDAPRLLILLAERDPYAAEFAEFFLQTEGYEVTLALDVDDAARKFEQLLPQLAVIELLISGGRGADLCQRLKEAGVPACLAISTLDARDQALAAGADAFLRKPLDPLQFVSTVKDLLGKSAFLQGVTSR
jgi:DNA-binding transcriptional MerR regulator